MQTQWKAYEAEKKIIEQKAISDKATFIQDEMDRSKTAADTATAAAAAAAAAAALVGGAPTSSSSATQPAAATTRTPASSSSDQAAAAAAAAAVAKSGTLVAVDKSEHSTMGGSAYIYGCWIYSLLCSRRGTFRTCP